MSRKLCKQTSIVITQATIDKIMSWSQSLNEIIFIAAERNGVIEDAFRLINYSRAPRNYFEYCEIEKRKLISELKTKSFDKFYLSHSHPSKHHLRRPSPLDIKNTRKGTIILIVFPNEKVIGVWKIKCDQLVESRNLHLT